MPVLPQPALARMGPGCAELSRMEPRLVTAPLPEEWAHAGIQQRETRASQPPASRHGNAKRLCVIGFGFSISQPVYS